MARVGCGAGEKHNSFLYPGSGAPEENLLPRPGWGCASEKHNSFLYPGSGAQEENLLQ